MKDLLIDCCNRLDRNEFTCHGIDRQAASKFLLLSFCIQFSSRSSVPSSKIVCYKCGLKMFKELAYQFRVSLRPDDIHPVIMRNRDDCYYGKRCRTQFTKLAHAQKFNHACDQTKF